jgi:hypothetical protein
MTRTESPERLDVDRQVNDNRRDLHGHAGSVEEHGGFGPFVQLDDEREEGEDERRVEERLQ